MRDFRNDRLGEPYLNPIDQGVRADERMRGRLPDAYAGSSSEAARARERMDSAHDGTRHISRRSRLIVGWTIALLIIGFFVAAFAGWIDIFPGT